MGPMQSTPEAPPPARPAPTRRALTARRRIEVFYADLQAAVDARAAARDELTDRRVHPAERAAVLRGLARREKEDARTRRRSFGVEDFVFERKIGEGSYGEVFLVRLRDSGELFALKKIDKASVLRSRFVAHVWLERFVLATCGNQPFVCRMVASFQDCAYLYFLCEYLPGGDLLSMLQREDRLRPEVARFYVAEIVIALDSLHRCGVIHRDVKPDNVIFGAHGHVRLADFGLSKSLMHVPPPLPRSQRPAPDADAARRRPAARDGLARDGSTIYDHDPGLRSQAGAARPPAAYPHPLPTGLTPQYLDHVRSGAGSRVDIPVDQRRTGWSAVARLVAMTAVGTPNYIAPEVLRGSPYNETADWWSVGIILYEMLVGWPPFQDDDTRFTFTMILDSEACLTFQDAYSHAPLVGPVAEDLIRALLNPDPKLRMGAQRGLDEFKEHPFFAGIPWDTIQDMRPPFVPTLESDTDTRYFDDYDLTTTTASHEDDSGGADPTNARASGHERTPSAARAPPMRTRSIGASTASFAVHPSSLPPGAQATPDALVAAAAQAAASNAGGPSSADSTTRAPGVVVLGDHALVSEFREDTASFPSSSISRATNASVGSASGALPHSDSPVRAGAFHPVPHASGEPSGATVHNSGSDGSGPGVVRVLNNQSSTDESANEPASRNREHDRVRGVPISTPAQHGKDGRASPATEVNSRRMRYEMRCVHPEFVGFTFISRAPPSRRGIPEDLFQAPVPEPAPAAIAAAAAVLSPFESSGGFDEGRLVTHDSAPLGSPRLARRGRRNQPGSSHASLTDDGRPGNDARRQDLVDSGSEHEDDMFSEESDGDNNFDDVSSVEWADNFSRDRTLLRHTAAESSRSFEDDAPGMLGPGVGIAPDVEAEHERVPSEFLASESRSETLESGDTGSESSSEFGSENDENEPLPMDTRIAGHSMRRPMRGLPHPRIMLRGNLDRRLQNVSSSELRDSSELVDLFRNVMDGARMSGQTANIPEEEPAREGLETEEARDLGSRSDSLRFPVYQGGSGIGSDSKLVSSPTGQGESSSTTPPPPARTSSGQSASPSPPIGFSRTPASRRSDIRRSRVLPPGMFSASGAADSGGSANHSRAASGRVMSRPTHSRRTDANQRSIFSVSQAVNASAREDAEFLDPGLLDAANISGILPALEVAAAIAAADVESGARQPSPPRSPVSNGVVEGPASPQNSPHVSTESHGVDLPKDYRAASEAQAGSSNVPVAAREK